MRRRAGVRAGKSVLEFTLVGIPCLFLMFSAFEMARAMWTYTTLAHAVKRGSRYLVVHGKGCAYPNSCQVSVGQIAGRIQAEGVGLTPDQLTLTFKTNGSTVSGKLANLLTDSTIWPPATLNAAGTDVTISGTYSFPTVMAFFWPGTGRSQDTLRTINFGAASTEKIQF